MSVGRQRGDDLAGEAQHLAPWSRPRRRVRTGRSGRPGAGGTRTRSRRRSCRRRRAGPRTARGSRSAGPQDPTVSGDDLRRERLSMLRPALRVSQPMPPPRVSPPTPVWLTTPTGVASPCAGQPRCHRAARRRRPARYGGRVDHDLVIGRRSTISPSSTPTDRTCRASRSAPRSRARSPARTAPPRSTSAAAPGLCNQSLVDVDSRFTGRALSVILVLSCQDGWDPGPEDLGIQARGPGSSSSSSGSRREARTPRHSGFKLLPSEGDSVDWGCCWATRKHGRRLSGAGLRHDLRLY